MKPIRALVADDEPVARELLRSMLGDHADIEIVAECPDGQRTVQAIREERPHVAFLDIRMPRLNGLEVAASLGARDRPHIVFVTAFDEFAVRAFELHALDYLLKPFDERRLGQTLERVRAALSQGAAMKSAEQVEAFLGRLDRIGRSLERVAVRKGAATVVLPLRTVRWIESEANYVRLHTGQDSYLLRATLKDLERRLDVNRFVRVHRGTIVNIDCVERMIPCGRGDYRLVLGGGTEVKLSRRFRVRLTGLLGGLS